jgi:hypothetical protein
LKCSKEELADALRGHMSPMHKQLLVLFLERLDGLNRQIHSLETMAAAAMQSHEDAVIRLAGVAGFGAESAQQILAEVGPEARSFDAPGQFASWVGCCPGRSESAEKNRSSRSPKGNRFPSGGREERLFLAAHVSTLAAKPGLPTSPLGDSLTNSAVWSGKSSMKAFPMSNKEMNPAQKPSNKELKRRSGLFAE